MKSIKTIDDLISELRTEYESVPKPMQSKAFINKCSKKYTQLYETKLYLETNPSEEFLKSEILRINKLIKSKQLQFDDWWSSNAKDLSKKDALSKYKSMYRISTLKNHIKNIEFILT